MELAIALALVVIAVVAYLSWNLRRDPWILAAAAHCSFYPVSGADVTSKWVAESERSVRRVFDRSRDNRAIANRRESEGS